MSSLDAWRQLSESQQLRLLIEHVEWVVFKKVFIEDAHISPYSLCAVVESRRVALCSSTEWRTTEIKAKARSVVKNGTYGDKDKTIAYLCWCLVEDAEKTYEGEWVRREVDSVVDHYLCLAEPMKRESPIGKWLIEHNAYPTSFRVATFEPRSDMTRHGRAD